MTATGGYVVLRWLEANNCVAVTHEFALQLHCWRDVAEPCGGGVIVADSRHKQPKRNDSINGETGPTIMTDVGLGYMGHFCRHFAVLFFHFA